MDKNTKLDIAIATDNGYFELARTSVMSLLHTNRHLQFHIHLLDNGLDSGSVESLRNLAKDSGATLSVYPIDDLSDRLGIAVPQTIAITSYSRLFIASILPEHVKHVLYVDCDTLFTGSLDALVDFDFGDNWVAGVLDPITGMSYKREIGIPRDEPYLNAGVLYIPLDKWRELDMAGRFINFLIENKGHVHHHDQGIINSVCQGHKAICHPRFNVMSNCYSYGWRRISDMMPSRYYSEAEFNSALDKPAVLHFTGADMGRPWTTDCRHPYKDLFLTYYQKNLDGNPVRLKTVSLPWMIKFERWLFENMPSAIFKYAMRGINNLAYIRHRMR